MKKLSILIVALLVVAGFGFAQDVTFSGDATLTVGFDLDSSQFGFKNEASSALSVKWTFDDASNGGTGAFIELTKMSFEAKDDGVNIDDPTVSAGLIFAPITVTIYSAPSMKFGNAAGFKFTPDAPSSARDDVAPALSTNNIATAAGADSVELLWVADADVATDDTVIDSTTVAGYSFISRPVAGDAAVAATFQGLTITADIDPLSVDVFVVTDGTWVENTDNAVAFGATVTASIDPLSVEAGVLYGPTDAADLGATVGLGGTFGPATVDVGFDYFDATGYDASVDISVDLGVASISSLTYIQGLNDVDLEMFEEIVVDASAAVDGLTLKNTTQLETILATDALEWYNATDLAYDLGGIKPFALVELYDVGADLQVDLEAGVELTGQIELTTFTLKWSADDVTNDNLGAVTFATKIKY